MSLNLLRDLVAAADEAESRASALQSAPDDPGAHASATADSDPCACAELEWQAVHVPPELLVEVAEAALDDADAARLAAAELELLVNLAGVLAPQDALDLRDLLALTITVPSAGERRAPGLGLLVSMVLDGGGEVPQVRDYEGLRRRQDDPNAFPSASKLSRDFSGWAHAVAAAMRLAFDAAPRVPSNGRHVPSKEKPRRNCSVSELAVALLRGARTLGYWPGERDWLMYEQVARELHHYAGGGGECPVPSLEPFRTRWGTWNAGVKAVQRMVREHGTDPMATTSPLSPQKAVGGPRL